MLLSILLGGQYLAAWHSAVSIQGESLQEVKANSGLHMQVDTCCSREKLEMKWLVESCSPVYYIKVLAQEKRLLQHSQAVSWWRGKAKQSSVYLSRGSWLLNKVTDKTLEIDSFHSTPENILGYIATEVKTSWTPWRWLSPISYKELPFISEGHIPWPW